MIQEFRLGPRQETEEESLHRAKLISDVILTGLKVFEEMNMEAVTRCKMRVHSVMHQLDSSGNVEYETVSLMTVYGDTEENKQWSKWTPNASVSITISNPAAMKKLSTGHEFFVDFIPCK